MGKDDLPALGGKPKKKKDKGPNLAKKNAAEARKHPQPDNQMQPEDPLGEFGDGSKIAKEWRGVGYVVAKVMRQRQEICWAIVLARLLQAIYNIVNPSSCNEFLHDDLVVHLKLKKKTHKQVQTSMKLQNLKDATNHIATKGLLKAKMSGYTKAGGSVGCHGKWNFLTAQSPSADFIKSKVDISPVAISFEIDLSFHKLEKSIYKVQRNSSEELAEGEIEGHAVLIVAYGYTKEQQLFFVTQNSWGDEWGVKGYGRIFIDENSKTTVVYPEV